MKVSLEDIQAYYAQQIRRQPEYQADESKKVVLRLPTDSVDISYAGRALARGRLRVRMDDDGAYSRVTGDNSDPRMKLVETTMRDVKKKLDEMKELTTLLEDEEITIEDRYATQIRLVEIEGEIEKLMYQKNKEFAKLSGDDDPDSKNPKWYVTDRASGEVFELRSFDSYIDKKTSLKKDMINRVMMRELDPEGFEEHVQKYREIYEAEFAALYEEGVGMWSNNGPSKLLELELDPELVGKTFPTNKFDQPEEGQFAGTVDLEDVWNATMNFDWDSAQGAVFLQPEIDADPYEILMAEYVEKKIAQLEKDDFEEFNSMRISVISARMAKESGAYIDTLTAKLTQQFERFAAVNELVGEDAEQSSLDAGERERQIFQITRGVMWFIKDKILMNGIQKPAVREDAQNFAIKVERKEAEIADPLAPEVISWGEWWRNHRPDVFRQETFPGIESFVNKEEKE